jgi:hypothetical protein
MERRHPYPMTRWTGLAFAALLSACAPMTPAERAGDEKPLRGYAGTVQKVFHIVRQAEALPGVRLLGDLGNLVGSALRQVGETRQYVIRTPSGQIMAQSDAEFSVGDCVEVIPQDGAASGPAFRYGQAVVVRSDNCNT